MFVISVEYICYIACYHQRRRDVVSWATQPFRFFGCHFICFGRFSALPSSSSSSILFIVVYWFIFLWYFFSSLLASCLPLEPPASKWLIASLALSSWRTCAPDPHTILSSYWSKIVCARVKWKIEWTTAWSACQLEDVFMLSWLLFINLRENWLDGTFQSLG